MKLALTEANLSPSDIDVISAHATSTVIGDRSETAAIKSVFGDDAYRIPVTANKSMTGHMLGASGGVEAIALVKSLQEGVIPPTINLDAADPDAIWIMCLTRRDRLRFGSACPTPSASVDTTRRLLSGNMSMNNSKNRRPPYWSIRSHLKLPAENGEFRGTLRPQ